MELRAAKLQMLGFGGLVLVWASEKNKMIADLGSLGRLIRLIIGACWDAQQRIERERRSKQGLAPTYLHAAKLTTIRHSGSSH